MEFGAWPLNGQNFIITDENEWEIGGHIAEVLEYHSKKLVFNFSIYQKASNSIFLRKG